MKLISNSPKKISIECSFTLTLKHINVDFKIRIVTGISLTKANGVIQFAIAERILGPFGGIEVANDKAVWKLSKQFVIKSNQTKDGIDYHTLTYENRSINLDTIVAPDDRVVVTGVRLNKHSNGHLILEVRFTEVDWNAGKLINLDQSVWLSNSFGGKKRLNYDVLELPSKSSSPSTAIFDENTFIRFGPTHRKIDISQKTIPFIDSLKVEPIIPVSCQFYGKEF